MRKWMFAMLLAGCSFEAHCGGKDTIKQAEAESGTTDALKSQGLDPTAVHCDTADVPPEIGKTFVCHVELDGKKTYDYRATIDKRDGDQIHFQLAPIDPRAVNGHKLETSLAGGLGKELGVDVAADCREPLPSVPADGTLACDIVAAGFAHVVDVHIDDQLNVTNVTYQGLVTRKSIEDAFVGANPGATVACGKDPLVKEEGLVCEVNGGAATVTTHASGDKITWSQN